MGKGGEAVPKPGSRAHRELLERKRQTAASAAMEAIVGLCVSVGVPAAIVLTVYYGAWWVFIPLGVLLIGALILGEVFKKPKSD